MYEGVQSEQSLRARLGEDIQIPRTPRWRRDRVQEYESTDVTDLASAHLRCDMISCDNQNRNLQLDSRVYHLLLIVILPR